MMKLMTFADAEYAGKRKQTCRESLLNKTGQVVPWECLIALTEPFSFQRAKEVAPPMQVDKLLHGMET